MEYNMDILVAGCNTNCRHCYVNGGPGKQMPLGDYLLCMDKLLPVFQHFGERISFTLDNEPYNHPDFSVLLHHTHEHYWPFYSHHGSTTGIAFNHRKDKEAIWQLQKEYGIDFASITLHGDEKNHNFLTQNSHAFAEAMDYIRFVNEHQGKLYLSLMLSKLLIEDREAITQIIQWAQPYQVYFAIPTFAPSPRMRAYQAYRPTYEECMLLQGFLSRWKQDEKALLKRFQQGRSTVLLQRLEQQGHFDFTQPQQCFLTVHPNLNLYMGNTGMETALLGNLRDLSSESIIQAMEKAPANYNFFPACFPQIPSFDEWLSKAHSTVQEDLVYPDMDSFLVSVM